MRRSKKSYPAPFKSKLEHEFYLRTGLPYEEIKLTYTLEHQYTPDFTLGPDTYVEVKDHWDGKSRSKHLAVKKQRPHVRVIFAFPNPNRALRKGSKQTYGSWCQKNGFEFIDLSHGINTLGIGQLGVRKPDKT